MSEVVCQNKGIQDWSEVCLAPRLLIGQLFHIKMNYYMCKNIIAHVKVNYCAYKNFTAHLKVNYCACEIDFCIFFFLYLPVIIFLTLVISDSEHVEVTLQIPSLSALALSQLEKQIHSCSLKRSIQNMVRLPKNLQRAWCSWKSSLPPWLHELLSKQEDEEKAASYSANTAMQVHVYQHQPYMSWGNQAQKQQVTLL